MYDDEFYEEIDRINKESRKITCGHCKADTALEQQGISFYCLACDGQVNSSGQAIAYPEGRGEDYAGERYDDY